MARPPVDGVPFASIPWRSTAQLWGAGTEENAALRFTGHGIVRVLSDDPDTGALWLVTLSGPFDVSYDESRRAEDMSWWPRAGGA
ncbi:MAG: hypothetical protein R2761_03280 [Acidimicrobiales bacterium]